MTLETSRVPEPGSGSLQCCLVEGDPQSKKRARRIKQRAVAISIALQTIALTALVLFPLLSKGERIAAPYFTPIPPFPSIGHHNPATSPRPHTAQAPQPCHICPPRQIPTVIRMHDPGPDRISDDANGNIIPGVPEMPGVRDSLYTSNAHPVAPPPDQPAQKQRFKVSESLQMAQLITRVEPLYPTLAIQTRKEGRVELHAIIGTDGSIKSLEVISGDPFFITSALSAVRQWRYRPTILNGQPIEVDTHITVIYTLNH
jgi:periplasmic protein TonB